MEVALKSLSASKAETVMVAKKWVGQRLKRKEDIRLLTGKGRFVDDIKIPGMHFVAILRSPYAHAKIKRIETSRALKQPGVLAVVTGKEIQEMTNPMAPAPALPIEYYPMAVEKTRFVGEPVAAVVASSRYLAEDALEWIEVDYEPLEPVITI